MLPGKDILSAKDLKIGYPGQQGETVIMNNINVSARHGELVALIGRNGSGKSTLLRSLVAMQPSLSGTVILNGNPLQNISRTELTKTISFTSTEPIDIHNIRVREAVALGRFPYTNWLGTLSDEDKLQIEEALNITGLRQLADRKIDRLSDGERQRVLIARSLAQDTELLVMDEPTAFLDLPSRYSIVSLLRKLSRAKNKCIVYSTHDLDTALNEADKLWLMKPDGICQGAPEDLVLNRSLANAFENPLLSFNTSSGTFSIVRTPRGSVALEGSGQLKKWTEKALLRSDFKIDASAACHIKTIESNDHKEWHVILSDDRERVFYTLYDMVSYLGDATLIER